jgi:hypothetical protein
VCNSCERSDVDDGRDVTEVPFDARPGVRTVVRRPLCATLLACAVLLGGCRSAGDRDVSSSAVEEVAGVPAATIDGDRLLLLDARGTPRAIATVGADEGEFVHAAIRPGDRDRTTVLALTRVPDDARPRYELRYVVDEPAGATDLYWFPWRLQVDEALADVVDTPPLPVWSPDGATVAWVEWDADGALLRTVEWRDDGVSSNPSDDVAAYRLEGVAPGAQLEAWEVGSDGVPLLRAVEGSTTWRIRLDVGRRAIAMADPA